MTSHTPGPWRLEYDEDAAATLLYGADGFRLAELLSANHRDDRLLAAAPDLLAACQAALGLAEFAYSAIPGSAVEIAETAEQIQAAVLKATEEVTG